MTEGTEGTEGESIVTHPLSQWLQLFWTEAYTDLQ